MARVLGIVFIVAIVAMFGPGVLWWLFSSPIGFVFLFLLLARR